MDVMDVWWVKDPLDNAFGKFTPPSRSIISIYIDSIGNNYYIRRTYNPLFTTLKNYFKLSFIEVKLHKTLM